MKLEFGLGSNKCLSSDDIGIICINVLVPGPMREGGQSVHRSGDRRAKRRPVNL